MGISWFWSYKPITEKSNEIFCFCLAHAMKGYTHCWNNTFCLKQWMKMKECERGEKQNNMAESCPCCGRRDIGQLKI